MTVGASDAQTKTSSGAVQVESEIDVDSMFYDPEQTSIRNQASNFNSSASLHVGAPVGGTPPLLEMLSATDIQHLATLLRPAILQKGVEKTKPYQSLEEPAWNNETASSQEERIIDDAEWHSPFGETTFSLLYMCSGTSSAFWYAMFVYLLQMTTIVLTLVDVIDWKSENGLNLPPNVSLSVTIAQGLALIQAVAFQSDLIEAIMKLQDGFHPEVLAKHPGATYATWLVSCTAQLFFGLLLLVAVFILVMQVDNVLDIMLNFAALNFIEEIDNVGFHIAKSGFVGGRLKRATQDVINLEMPRRKSSSRQGFFQHYWKIGVFLLILSSLLAGWVAVVFSQTSGHYMCKTFMVNMADDFIPALSTFNGMYDLEFSGGFSLARRGQYIERRSTEIGTPGRGIFGYCNKLKVWTFRLDSVDEQGDPCDWIARSSETDTYDITEAAKNPWFVRDLELREVALEPFRLFCFDCKHEDEERSDDCGGKGTCSNAVCQCEDGRYGLRCEFVSPCPRITVDARTEDFASTRDWAKDYQTIQLSDATMVEAYHRPVYVHEYPGGGYDVVMFTGGHWALTSSEFLPQNGRILDGDLSNGQEGTGSDIANYFKYAFHGYRGYAEKYFVSFLSDYMEVGTRWDSSSPVGFHWHHAETKGSTAGYENQGIAKDIYTEFLCELCDDKINHCLYDGQCVNGKCECPLDASGNVCEVPPVGNGHCDPYLNSPEFKMDGGDCCESTCISTTEYVCGTEQLGFVSRGYYFCELPSNQWQHYTLEGEKAGSLFGFAVDLTGTSMAVSEPGLDRVLIYDKVGSSWILRDTISVDQRSFFGLNVAISAGPYNVVNNPSFKPPLTVGILDFGYTLRIYTCNSDGCIQKQEFHNTSEFEVSDDGTVVATSLIDKIPPVEPPKVVRVYQLRDGLFQFRKDVNITMHNTTAYLRSISLSEDGSRLALQSELHRLNQQNFKETYNEVINVLIWNDVAASYDLEAQFEFASKLNILEIPLSVALSHDGKTLAYSLPDCLDFQLHVRALNAMGKWEAVPAPTITIEPMHNCDEYRGYRVSNNGIAISGDGSTIAVRAGSTVSVYKQEVESNTWEHVGEAFSFAHYSVALSSGGTELATGAPGAGIGGSTNSYSLPGRRVCSHGKSLLRISVTLDIWSPEEVFWDVLDNRTGEVLFQEGPYTLEYALGTFVEETCVASNACYAFTIYNKNNTGLLQPGEYALFWDGEVVGQGTFSGLFDRVYFGDCAPCPVGTESLMLMVRSCEQLSWHLLEAVTENEMNSLSLASEDNQTEIPLFCNEMWLESNCTNWVHYERCLDPTECYGFQLLSHQKAYAEVLLGEQRAQPTSQTVCARDIVKVGNAGKCTDQAWKVLYAAEN